MRSSLVWEAEMQIRALARSKGVAGNATVTTATWMKNHEELSVCPSNRRLPRLAMEIFLAKKKKDDAFLLSSGKKVEPSKTKIKIIMGSVE